MLRLGLRKRVVACDITPLPAVSSRCPTETLQISVCPTNQRDSRTSPYQRLPSIRRGAWSRGWRDVPFEASFMIDIQSDQTVSVE